MPRKKPTKIEKTATPGIARHWYSSTSSVYLVRVTANRPDGSRIQRTGKAPKMREALEVKRALEAEIEAELAGLKNQYLEEMTLQGHLRSLVKRGILDPKAVQTVVEHTHPGAIVGASQTTLSDFAKSWVAYAQNDPEISDKTLQNYLTDLERHILPVLGDKPLVTLTARDIQGWIDSQNEVGAANKTIGRRLRLIKRMLDRAVIDGHLASNPSAAVKYRVKEKSYTAREPGSLTPAQIARVLTVCDPEWRLHMRLCFVTGLRSGEILGARYSWINWDAGVLEVHGTKTDNADRLVPLDPVTLEGLRAHQIAQGAQDGDLIWTKPEGSPWASNPVGRKERLQAWLDLAGITIKFKTHGTRRSYNTIVDHAIADPAQHKALRATMGHANAKMTAHYSTPDLEVQANQQAYVANLIDSELAKV